MELVNDNQRTNCNIGSKIIYNAEILKSNLGDYNDVYILLRGNINIIEHQKKQVAFIDFAPFTT